MPNHTGTQHAQFPPYQQNWVPPSPQSHAGMMGNHVQGKGTPPPPQANVVGSPRPLNYLKQHLQHKGSYVGGSSPTPPQGYGNGPAGSMHLPMGPPHHMGPPHGPTNMGPPSSGLQQVGGPPSTQLSTDGSSTPDHGVISQDNGITSSGSSVAGAHPVTSVVTTGPDGTQLDEASQQSTLSNASAASGEDPQCTTPKSRKNDPYSQSHLAPPSTSPGGHPHNEDFEMNSPPNWSRTPASPVFNSHVPQETYRTSSKKSDSLCKLYDMDDNPDRRGWLDKLLSFMEERRTPITACPTISKQPLDLYRLYVYVKERGGFVEVTKSKTWKDIAGLLGIGASSSAAYTLRKHYTKNLLAFECHFDRGDIDPLPIIQQVEAGSKKKSAKAASVPSPGSATAGSSNSQDSFPAPVVANTTIDSYPGYPSGYPSGTQPDYNAGAQIQRPPSQTNAQTPHAGAPYPGQPGYNQYGSSEQYNSSVPAGQFTQGQGQFPPQNRNMYPPYGPEGEASSPAANTYPYGSRPYNQPPTGATQTVPPPGGNTPAPTGPPTGAGSSPSTYPPSGPQQPDYYRPPEQSPQPRRHPDFVKDSQGYAGYNQRPQMYGGWQGSPGQYRGQYPPSPTPQAWCNSPRASGPPPPPNQQATAQWDQHRYPTQSQPPYPANQQQPWTNMSSPQQSPGSPLRPPPQRMPGGGAVVGISAAASISTGGKPPFNMPPPQVSGTSSAVPPPCPSGVVGAPPSVAVSGPSMPPGPTAMPGVNKATPPPPQPGPFPPAAQMQKKDIVFPPDSVESTTPVLYRRKRLAKNDVCPIDPWRIFMSLRSGLLCESTWALDILNILLYDDSTIQYFGLAHLPGLLSLLLEHFQKNLAEMFENENNDCVTSICSRSRARHYENNADKDCNYSVDLGQLLAPTNSEEKVLLLSNTPNYTMVSRKNMPVRIQNADDDIFVSEHLKPWDFDSNQKYQLTVPIGSDAWTYDHIESDPHDNVIDVFKSEIIDIPFARYIGGRRSKKDKSGKSFHDYMDREEVGIAGDDEENSSNKVLAFNKKRRHISISSNTSSNNNKNGLSNLVSTPKKCKLNFLESNSGDVDATANTISNKEEIKKEEPEEVTVGADGLICERSSDSVIKPKDLDSDCREVDMDIEHPRVLLNGAPPPAKKSDFDPKASVRDPASVLQRRRMSGYEDECYTRDEASLYLVNESQDSLARRCICLSNIFRNLTFVPGNETILAKSSKFLALLGKLLLLNHEHLLRTPKTRNYDREEDTDFSDSCSSLHGEKEWWWDYLITIRENMLVAVANIAGHLELARYEEIITRPVLDGLLHWAVCPSAHGQDPFPSCGTNSALSPQRLALEALCKLCVTDANVDLVIATPPHSRLEKLCAVLTRHLCRNEDQVLREFSVNLLHYLAAADSSMARAVALQSPCISYLVAFIEQAEQTAIGVANQHGINYLRENPDSMGTSLDMLRRAAGTLLHLSRHPDNRSLFMQQEPRLLGLVMSHILDQQVALIISRVLFQVSRGPGPMPSMEYRLQQRQQLQQQQQDNIKSNENKKLMHQQQQQQQQQPFANPQLPAIVVDEVGGTGGEISTNANVASAATVIAVTNFASSNVHSSNSNSSSSSYSNSSLTCNKSEEILAPPSATLNDISNSSNSSCGSTNSNSNSSTNITTPIGGATTIPPPTIPSPSSSSSSIASSSAGQTASSTPLSATPLNSIENAALVSASASASASASPSASASSSQGNSGIVAVSSNNNKNLSTTTATITGNSSNSSNSSSSNNNNNSSNSNNNTNIKATTSTTAAVA